MCTNYKPTARDRFRAERLGVAHLPHLQWPAEVFPGFQAPVVVRDPLSPSGSASNVLELARFGLMPRWSRDAAHAASIAKGTYNARSETVADKPSFRSAWRERQWALVPMEHYFDPCWEDAAHHGGKSVRWRIGLASGEAFACAALWERWHNPAPEAANDPVATSFTLLTVNADGHPLCGRLHRPGDEKRMPVIIRPDDYQAWLQATPDEAARLLRVFPAAELTGGPDEARKPAAELPQLSLFSG